MLMKVKELKDVVHSDLDHLVVDLQEVTGRFDAEEADAWRASLPVAAQLFTATALSRMAADPLCEIGCPYAARGFDFDHVGLIWGLDLVWRSGRWVVQPEHVLETEVGTLARGTLREQGLDGP